jgi:hypothetical protein
MNDEQLIWEAYTKTNDVMVLYRGDSSNIKTQSLDKADTKALFGQGIYLTNNKRIANDYKSKGGKPIFSLAGAKTKQEVIDYYIKILAGYIDENGNDIHPFDLSRKELPPFVDDPIRLKRLEFARQKWEKEKHKYEIRIGVDKSGKILEKNTGYLSIYEVPNDFINKTYNVEEEIDPDVIDCLCLSIRDTDPSCSILKQITQTDEDGFRPTFRAVWNILRDYEQMLNQKSQIVFRRKMKDIGYTGLEYSGGITMGGGVLHRAFVFWDEQKINKFKKS